MEPATVEERAEDASRVFSLLGLGRPVRDAFFDRVYPPALRKLSKIHWTPVSVAMRAAELLVQGNEDARVLDVGSGAGKFCLVGGLSGPGHFTGIEQRGYFVQFANNLVQRHGLQRVRYVHGNMVNLDWSQFDAFYLFNPFYEHIAEPIRIDRFVSVSRERYDRYVHAVREKLKDLPAGTRVATYHGFGGEFPLEYTRIFQEPHGTGLIELWVKERGR